MYEERKSRKLKLGMWTFIMNYIMKYGL